MLRLRSKGMMPIKLTTTMCTLRPFAIIIGLMILLFSCPAGATCETGSKSCEPSSDEVRAKIERLLESAFLTPPSIVSLQKFDRRSFESQGREMYEIRLVLELRYPGDELRCRSNLCPELQNYLLKIDKAAKTATIAGWFFFERTDRGWR